jgi:hypothetical protein
MKHSRWRQLVVLLAVAFALRLAAGWVWQSRLDGRFALGDSIGYWALAQTIATGQPYEFGHLHDYVFRTPGYPVLLAPIVRWVGDGPAGVLAARAEAALLGTLAVLGVWWLARLLFDDRAALLAAAIAAVYPGAIVLSVLVLSEAPFCPLLLLQLALWTLAWNASGSRQTAGWSFSAGLAAGAATLMRPSWLLFTPFAVGVGVVVELLHIRPAAPARTRLASAGTADPTTASHSNDRPSYRRPLNIARHAVIALWMFLGLAAAMAPWWIRNVCVTGHFVPTTLQVGASLYDGLNPNATGASNMDFVPRYQSKESSEWERDRQMRSDALSWVGTNPGRAARLAAVKFLRMWNGWPNEPQLAGWPGCAAVFFTYTPLLLFAIIGAWRTLGRGWPYILCWLPAVYLTLLHVVFVSSIRYREPAMLALIALATGAGISGWRQGKQEGETRREGEKEP